MKIYKTTTKSKKKLQIMTLNVLYMVNAILYVIVFSATIYDCRESKMVISQPKQKQSKRSNKKKHNSTHILLLFIVKKLRMYT